MQVLENVLAKNRLAHRLCGRWHDHADLVLGKREAHSRTSSW